jgi:hypothetical protein
MTCVAYLLIPFLCGALANPAPLHLQDNGLTDLPGTLEFSSSQLPGQLLSNVSQITSLHTHTTSYSFLWTRNKRKVLTMECGKGLGLTMSYRKTSCSTGLNKQQPSCLSGPWTGVMLDGARDLCSFRLVFIFRSLPHDPVWLLESTHCIHIPASRCRHVLAL